MSKRIFSIMLMIVSLIVFLTACGKPATTETLTIDVETGDKFEVTLDISRQLAMEIDENGIVYFFDATGTSGAYLMFMTQDHITSMMAQFEGGMATRKMGNYEVQFFYAMLDGTPSAVAFMEMNNTGIAVISTISDDTVEVILENLVIKLL